MPPVIKESSSLVTAHQGQDAVLPCEALGDTSPTVTWRKDGFPLSHDSNKYVLCFCLCRPGLVSDGSVSINGSNVVRWFD